MGRTIPSFRIATDMKWKIYQKYLGNKNNDERKLFKQMFSIARLYNSACSYSNNLFRIYPILMSIILHNYKYFFLNYKRIMRKIRIRIVVTI
jgi:hypothetical protein